MKDLSVVQEYFILAVNEKGVISSLNMQSYVCLVAGGLLELQMNDCIEIDDKMIFVINPLPEKLNHLKSLYDFINKSDSIKINKLIETYSFSFPNKNLNMLIDDIGNSLEKLDIVKLGKAGLFGAKNSYKPEKEYISLVIDKIRSEVLEDIEVSDEVALLTVLLEKSTYLKQYFSKFEQKEIKNKINELCKTPKGKVVNNMIEHAFLGLTMEEFIMNKTVNNVIGHIMVIVIIPIISSTI